MGAPRGLLGKAPLKGNASLAHIQLKGLQEKKSEGMGGKQSHQFGGKQFESAMQLERVEGRREQREARVKRNGRESAVSDSLPPTGATHLPHHQHHISPGVRPKHVKVGKGNVFEVVEEAIAKARAKLEKIEDSERVDSFDGEEQYSQLERQNKALRAELKSLNGNLNLILQQFDSFDFAKKRAQSQRPSSMKRMKARSEEVKNNEKMLMNAQHEHERMVRRLQQVQDINYQIELQKGIAETQQRSREVEREIKKLQNGQREREKKMDGMIIHDTQDCVVRVQDLTNQLSVVYDKLTRKEADLARTADVKTKMGEHLGQLRVANENITKIAKHYGVDLSLVNPGVTGMNHQAAENPRLEKYGQLEKKLKLTESDFERVRLKNRIGEMKKQRKALTAKRQQLQSELQ